MAERRHQDESNEMVQKALAMGSTRPFDDIRAVAAEYIADAEQRGYERGKAEGAAPWEALAEWESANVFHEVHWDSGRCFAVDDDADGISCEVAAVEFPAGELDHSAHARDLCAKLGLEVKPHG